MQVSPCQHTPKLDRASGSMLHLRGVLRYERYTRAGVIALHKLSYFFVSTVEPQSEQAKKMDTVFQSLEQAQLFTGLTQHRILISDTQKRAC